MNNHAVGVVLATLAIGAVACGRSALPAPDAGMADAGGSALDAGSLADAGGPSVDGGGMPDAGSLADGGIVACAAPLLRSWSVPWIVSATPANVPQGCTATGPNFDGVYIGQAHYLLACSGIADVTVAGSGIVLQVPNSISLTWPATPQLIGHPSLTNGSRVQVNSLFERSYNYPFGCTGTPCPTVQRHRVVIRSIANGDILWAGDDGLRTDEPSSDFADQAARDALGVATTKAAACTFEFVDICYRYSRQLSGRMLTQYPFQVIPPGVTTRVDTSLGHFEVLWASEETTPIPNSGCFPSEYGGPPSDNGFAINRVP